MSTPNNEPMAHILVRYLPDGQIELLALDIGGQEAAPVFPTPEASKTFASDLSAAESHFVRSELHRTACNFVLKRLNRNGGPGLHPAAISAFGADGRYELLAQTWTAGTLEDFKATLRACIDAAIEAPHTPTPEQDNLSHRPETVPAEIQLPFFT